LTGRGAAGSCQTDNFSTKQTKKSPDNGAEKQVNSMIENYINGNLADAKKQAKRHSYAAIVRALAYDRGWGFVEAGAAAAFLKGTGTFQAACDAVRAAEGGAK
jgi:hypothetical protein